ncbi:cardiolipin synthase ClsB [soil metagenome]
MFKLVKAVKSSEKYTFGNSVKLVRGGVESFDLLEQIIAAAKQTIHFQFYIFEDDATGVRIATALKGAALRGIRVFVLLDAYASKSLSKSFVADLKNSGIQFKWFAPLFKGKNFYLGRRLHHKVVVVDSFHCLVAGLNISDRYNDTEKAPAWLDWALFAEGSIGEALAQTCIKRYKLRLSANQDKNNSYIMLSGTVRDAAVRARTNDWFGRRWEISRSYLEMFKTAKNNIIIMSPYFLPGVIFRRAIKIAAKRGVTIKVILAGVSDIGTSKYAERYLYRWLFKNNIQIFEYQKNVLHGKIAVCDRQWVTIGSYNLNNLSAYASVELNLDIANSQLATNAENSLQELIEKDCKLISPQEYDRTTGIVKRVMQKLAYNLLRLAAFFITRKRD